MNSRVMLIIKEIQQVFFILNAKLFHLLKTQFILKLSYEETNTFCFDNNQI